MGTSISSGASQSVSSTSAWQARKQDFQDLTKALKSGNLDQAKAAFAQLEKDDPNAAKDPNSPLAQIGKALQSGDLAGAQNVATKMQSHRHGGHHKRSDASTEKPPALPNPTDTMGNNVNTLA